MNFEVPRQKKRNQHAKDCLGVDTGMGQQLSLIDQIFTPAKDVSKKMVSRNSQSKHGHPLTWPVATSCCQFFLLNWQLASPALAGSSSSYHC